MLCPSPAASRCARGACSRASNTGGVARRLVLLRPSDSTCPGRGLLGVLDPADELIARNGRDVRPCLKCDRVRDERGPQVPWQPMHDATRHSFPAHAPRVARRRSPRVPRRAHCHVYGMWGRRAVEPSPWLSPRGESVWRAANAAGTPSEGTCPASSMISTHEPGIVALVGVDATSGGKGLPAPHEPDGHRDRGEAARQLGHRGHDRRHDALLRTSRTRSYKVSASSTALVVTVRRPRPRGRVTAAR